MTSSSTFKRALWLLGLLTFTLAPVTVHGQEMTAEKLIEQHLDSIGTKEKRDSVKNWMAVGTSLFESKQPVKQAGGKAVVASDRGNLMYITSFNSQEYPFERIGYFKKEVSLPFVTAGNRSPLGAFIADHERVLSDGLFMGSVSNFWAMYSPDRYGNKIKFRGTKKVNDRKAYALEFFPKSTGSSEFSVMIYFDAENFRHLRTEYRDQINPSQDRFGTLGRQAGTTLSLIENFDDFRTADGLTLPYAYKAEYETSSNQGLYQFVWSIKVQQYLVNQNLATDFFTFEKK